MESLSVLWFHNLKLTGPFGLFKGQGLHVWFDFRKSLVNILKFEGFCRSCQIKQVSMENMNWLDPAGLSVNNKIRTFASNSERPELSKKQKGRKLRKSFYLFYSYPLYLVRFAWNCFFLLKRELAIQYISIGNSIFIGVKNMNIIIINF